MTVNKATFKQLLSAMGFRPGDASFKSEVWVTDSSEINPDVWIAIEPNVNGNERRWFDASSEYIDFDKFYLWLRKEANRQREEEEWELEMGDDL